MANVFDVIIIGAGAAGLMAASTLASQNRSVLLLDHAKKIGEKIRISGGGRCNFTNTHLNGLDSSQYFVSENPKFVRYALSNYTANDFTQLITEYDIPYHEKHRGQLFCDRSATDIIHLLTDRCARFGATIMMETEVTNITPFATQAKHSSSKKTPFTLSTSKGTFQSTYLIIASGGLAIPKIGATGFGYEVAKSFGHSIIPPRPALVPLQFEHWERDGFNTLAGIALPVEVSTQIGKKKTMTFHEDLLFRHKGLSGPAILQISSYWIPGNSITLNLVPDTDLATQLCEEKSGKKMQLDTALEKLAPNLPKRFVQHWMSQAAFANFAKRPWADVPNKILETLGKSLNAWELLPSGTDGHRVAEATRGGVNTKELNPRTMESNLAENLYFIGEVVDVVGWLGGYNFGWAWASAICAANAITHK